MAEFQHATVEGFEMRLRARTEGGVMSLYRWSKNPLMESGGSESNRIREENGSEKLLIQKILMILT